MISIRHDGIFWTIEMSLGVFKAVMVHVNLT